MVDLHHHGAAEAAPDLVDLAVNVYPGVPISRGLHGLGVPSDTFPGLGRSWIRIAARQPSIADVCLAAVADALGSVRQT